MDVKEKLRKFLINEGTKTACLLVYFGINAIVFFVTYQRYKTLPVYKTLGEGVTLARGAAAALNFNCALLLFPVLRNIMTWLRGTFVNKYAPLDEALQFHKLIAGMVAFFTAVHAVAHFYNFFNLAPTQSTTPQALAFGSIAGATGHALVLIMIIMYTAAMYKVRMQCFELFWYTHHLFVLFYALLLIHGTAGLLQPPEAWAWVIAPAFFYMFERALRVYRGEVTTEVNRIVQHPSQVMELQLVKPLGKLAFRYKAGQYLFLNCPAVSRAEWHPFTITSAPREDYVSVHVRVAGDWTEAVATMLGLKWGRDGKPQYDADNQAAEYQGRVFKFDGPFGSASEDVFKFPVAVLVGAGIGVTPFASILKSIWYRARDVRRMRLQKVYFLWICRDKTGVEWFSDLLAAMEAEEVLRELIDIRVYLTQKISAEDQAAITAAEKRQTVHDAMTGLLSATYFGRPDFEELFQELMQSHPASRIGIFLCGPPAIGKTLAVLSSRLTSAEENGTRFVFNKENF